MTTFLEYVSSTGTKPRVDRERGIITNMKVLGLESDNGRTYTRDAARNAIRMYEGSPVNLDHPPRGKESAPRSVTERFGVLRNVRQAADGSLYGDLHANPRHPFFEQLAWTAENAPDTLGLSHNVAGDTRNDRGRVIIEKITMVRSVDLVTQPATTRGLFEGKRPQFKPTDFVAKPIGFVSNAVTQFQPTRCVEQKSTMREPTPRPENPFVPQSAASKKFARSIKRIN